MSEVNVTKTNNQALILKHITLKWEPERGNENLFDDK